MLSQNFREKATRFVRNPVAVLALIVLGLLFLAAVFAPLIAPQDPYDLTQVTIFNARLAPGTEAFDGSMTYGLGTDDAGRDLWSAILYGLRISIGVGVISAAIGAAFGTSLGLLAAYSGGRVENVIMRLVDLQLSFPAILIALVLLATLGPGIDKVIIALVAVQWAYYARTIRSVALSEIAKDYVAAAKSQGLGSLHIIFRHVFPNCLPPLLVILTIQMAHAITLEATLSFLGLGLPPTEPSLGLLIANGFEFMLSSEYWISLYPGLALLILLLALNIVSDNLRTVFNPKQGH
ncbi:ABC transporter permease [Nitratireductor aquimarinus]|uniref:ABC transporter permease n=1 Tax=Nitratireductor aquimarinus TaxID=889300 RepID=UPI001A8F4AC7|nr:ABC transporter permease [Nitratireductor aquimarinus]MBN8245766.1 ABC transporter permease [Nitratireductor aquimarinus]MBY6134146.1 ABC transporter permease [Nitratireductor aquimarinus]MCA1305240.1 ABC transporter permease [Nitratireductor aquimarinus]